MSTPTTVSCRHCSFMNLAGLFHSLNCNCEHHHTDHIFRGGCKLCKCDGYTQATTKHTEKKEKVVLVGAPLIDVSKLTKVNKDHQALVEAQKRVDNLRKLL